MNTITETGEIPIGIDQSIRLRVAEFVAAEKVIGGCVIATDNRSEYFSNVALLEEYVGGGRNLGLASYVSAIRAAHREDRAFTTGMHVSLSATRVWGALAMLGVAEQREPFRYLRTENGVPIYGGLFVAPIGSTLRD